MIVLSHVFLFVWTWIACYALMGTLALITSMITYYKGEVPNAFYVFLGMMALALTVLVFLVTPIP